MVGPSPELAAAIEEAAARLETAPAGQAVAWALEQFGRDLVLAASFQDVALVDLATELDPGIEVVFLDTGAHFDETLGFVEEIRRRYDLNPTADTDPSPRRVAAHPPIVGRSRGPDRSGPGAAVDQGWATITTMATSTTAATATADAHTVRAARTAPGPAPPGGGAPGPSGTAPTGGAARWAWIRRSAGHNTPSASAVAAAHSTRPVSTQGSPVEIEPLDMAIRAKPSNGTP